MSFPALFDLQVNGGWVSEECRSVDFSAPGLTVRDCEMLTREMLRRGTAGYLPTVITGPLEVLETNLAVLADFIENSPFGCCCPGIHVEGPFFQPGPCIGAHRPEYCCEADLRVLDRLIVAAHNKIRIITVGADVPTIIPLVEYAVAQGIVVALGHHAGSDQQILDMVSAGARLATHLGNGSTHDVHRHGGHLSAQMANDQLYASIICDGQHLPGKFIRQVLCTKGVSKSILVSDAAPVAGAPVGHYQFAGQGVVVQEEPQGSFVRLANNPDRLAGSWQCLAGCLQHLLTLAENWLWQWPDQRRIERDELVSMARGNPLGLLGLDEAWLDECGSMSNNLEP